MNPFKFPKILLASKSPRRAELLKQMGVPFEVVLPLDDAAAELLELPVANENPIDYVQRVCLAKAQQMQAQIQTSTQFAEDEYPILCADTTVAFAQQILGKPESSAQAAQMLRLLSGNTHQVHTAVVLVHEGALLQAVVTTDVRFRSLSEADIAAYIESREPFDKAGGYGIQGLGACFIEHISGSFSAVKGLPVFEVAQLLHQVSRTQLV